VAPGPSRRSWGKRATLILAVLALPCVAGLWGVVFYLKGKARWEQQSQTAFRTPPAGNNSASEEARINLLALCQAVEEYRSETGTFLAAGPTPREVPKGGTPVPFPEDEAFKKLGFTPGTAVRFQYQVLVQENPVGEPEVTCYARGDQDGDGQNSVYSVTLDANGMTSPVKVQRENE
jgi:hypothetical protein